jgi:hypothetical protein
MVYWKLKEEVLDRAVWRTRFGIDYGPVIINDCSYLRPFTSLNHLLFTLFK